MRKLGKNINICDFITNTVEQVIINNKLINNNDKIVVAVSGGPDSMCLLSVLIELQEILKNKYNINYSLIVAHVNHMIREESEYEKDYVESFCNDKNIKFHYLKENIPELSKDLKLSEETCGRKVRYEFFEKIRKIENAQKIAVAHNEDDNVETILLNLIRGCGLKGLIGMDYKFEYLIRPLIDIEKKDILDYNVIKNLNPCFDKTNFEDTYLRNKVRLRLLPELKEKYNSNITQNIIRMKKILEQDEDFLKKYTNNIIEQSIIENNSVIKFRFDNIMKEHIAIQTRSIRSILEIKLRNLEGIENIHIVDILKLLKNNIVGKKYIIGNKFNIEIISKNIAVIK